MKSRRTWISIFYNFYKFSSKRQKTLWEKKKLLVKNNFSFSRSVSKGLVLQTRKNQSLFGKELTLYQNLTIYCGFTWNRWPEISLIFIYRRFRWALNSLFFGLKTMIFFNYKNSWFFNFLKTEISVDYPRPLYEEPILTTSAQQTRVKGSSYWHTRPANPLISPMSVNKTIIIK